MSSSSEQLKTQQAWREHHASNPKWPSEREKEERGQAFRARLVELRRNRDAHPAAAALVQAGITTVTPAVDIDNNNARQASSSETETVSASSSRSSTIRGSSNPPPPTSQSPSPVIDGVLPAPAACAAQATATCSEEPLADRVVPIKPSPSSIPLANMFDDSEDVDIVDNSKNIRANVETSTKASSSPVKKRKLPFGDDESEGDSDFEGHRAAKKAKASDVDAAASSKCKSGKDAIKPAETNLASTTIVKHASALENGPSGCYQNTVLHLLSSIPAFAAMGTEKPLKSAKAGIAQAFSRVMHEMLKNTSGKAIDTAIFRKACGDFLGSVFNGKTQQDADEFLCKLVDRLQR